jgi:hypothetical protein
VKKLIAKMERIAGRVVLGPKKVGNGYARIVSETDGCGRIESFDVDSRTWHPASEAVTFSEVWSAPAVAPLTWQRIGGKSSQ